MKEMEFRHVIAKFIMGIEISEKGNQERSGSLLGEAKVVWKVVIWHVGVIFWIVICIVKFAP